MKRTLFLCAFAVTAFHAVGSAQTPGRSVNMVSGTTLPDGDPFLQRQNEPSGGVSTRNPLHLLAGANDYRTVDIPGLPDGAENGDAWLGIYKSNDGGQTWRSTLIPGYPQDSSPAGLASPLRGYQAAADPTVRSGTNGLFYYSGIAFDRGATGKSAVFVSRFIDNNNVAGGDPIALLDTTVVDAGNQAKFLDKPYIAVDIPRPGGPMCTIRSPGTTAAQIIPAGAVYLAYQVFSGTDATPTSRLMLSRSVDCGATWSKPIKVKDLPKTNQGVQIAIAPATGEVYLTWRAFADPKLGGDAVLFSKSDDLKKLTFKNSVVFPMKPFDQNTTGTTFRTNSYPTIAVDGTGRIYLTWTERGWGPQSPDPAYPTLDPGDARVVMTTSRDGVTWTPKKPIEHNPTIHGHQIMPVVTAIGGKISVVYYDLREDVSSVFKLYVDEKDVTTKRHTLDLRILQTDPGDTPVFASSVRVSEYMYGVLSDPKGPGTLEQLQFNVPNLPLFAQGSAPFIGDFIDLAGEMFTKNAAGNWVFNNTNGPRTVHAFWTDNRDVRPPKDGNWKNYTPPLSRFNTQKVCTPGQTGMRNSNIYTSRITPGLLVGAPSNSKKLLPGTAPGQRRSFVVFAQNNTDQTRRYRFTILNQPPDGIATFLQFSTTPLATLETEVAARSTSSRTVYVSSSDEDASIKVDISEVQAGGTTGLTASVTLNPDKTNPTVTNPTVTNAEEFNPTVTNPTVTNPTVTNPTVTNPTVTNPTVTNVVLANPTVTNPTVTNPTVTNPTVTNPTVTNTEMVNQTLTDAELAKGVLTDTTWTVKNEGNVPGSFSVKTLLTRDKVPDNFKTHLLIYKTYTTPVTLPDDCEIKTESQMQLVASIPNPTVTNPTVTNPTETNDNVTNPTVTNASLWLDVGQEAKITFRVLNPDKTKTVEEIVTRPDGTVEKVFVSPEFNVAQVVAPAVVPTTVDTVDAAAGITTVEVVAPLIVTTTTLADAVANFTYSAQLTSVGGVGSARTWTLPLGSTLPPGLGLSPAGVLSGTPTAAGSFAFEVHVSDTAAAHIARADLVLKIAPSTSSLGLTTPEDQALDILLSAGGYANPLLVFATTSPANGTLTGTAPNVTYTPKANFNGTDSFTFTATIPGPAGPIITSPPATVSIDVTAVNDTPAAVNDAATTAQGTVVTIPVVANDTDADSDSLTVATFTQGGYGQVTLNAATGALVYTPAATFAGRDSFTYRVQDPSATLSSFANVVVTVNATGPASFVVTNTDDSGPGSLRTAIENANVNPFPDTITFNIPGGAPYTIAPLSALPDVTGPTVIDGTTQPGFSSAPVIELNGQVAGAGADGLSLASGSSTVRGFVINRFARMGVYLQGGTGHHVEGNYIGIDVAGAASRPNGENGIGIGNSSGNTIGGTTPFTRNVISGNGLDGIGIFGAGVNTILGNYVGTDRSGAMAVPNGRHGILVDGAGEAAVGNGTSAGRNLISGNTQHGVALTNCFPPAPCNGNLVTGNFIGTNVAGTAALPNHRNGINIHNSPRNVIRGNVISGNGDTTETQYYADGIGVFAPRIEDDPLSELHFGGQVIAGNKIGTDLSGTNPIPNLRFGVFLNGLTKTTVGGATPPDNNLIAFNLHSGVDIGWSTSNNNVVRGNTIRSNGGAGVVVRRGTGNRITGNSISANAGLGISLDTNGGSAVFFPNDTGDADAGPNDFQNFPVITAAIANPGSTTVSGSLDSTPTTAFTLEFFANPAADPSGYGEGQMFVGSTVVTTDTTGRATFNTTIFVSGLPGQIITATATDAAGNTSEFSQARLVPPVITTGFLPSATRIVPYSQPLLAAGTSGSTTWTVTAGSLPSGLTLNGATGTISGTPNAQDCNVSSFTVQVTDSATPTPQSASRTFFLAVTGSVIITTSALPVGVTFENYPFSVNTACGSGPKTWTVSGALPPGVGFNPSTGQFTQTNPPGVNSGPRQNGTFPLAISVSDSFGTDTKSLPLTVLAVDQQVFGFGAAATTIGGTSRIAQTVTVGASGTLKGVRAFSVSPVPPWTTCPLTVAIQGVNAATGAPDDSQIFTSVAVESSGGFVPVVPLPGLFFAADSRFAIVLSSTGACQLTSGAPFDNYGGGAAFVNTGGGWTQPSGTNAPVDFQFETLIENTTLSYLTKPRSQGARSVTLNTGKVLVIGTDGTAELFDPGSGVSVPTFNSMLTSRTEASVTRLADGRVLILGGSRFVPSPSPTNEIQATGEIFDPAAANGAGAFVPLTAVMSQGRASHTATLLKCPVSAPNCLWKDRVLIAGGFSVTQTGSTSVQTAEIFDPATSAFIPTGSMAATRISHAAAPLADGRVLIVGGFGFAPPGSPNAPPSAEIFDAGSGANGSFVATGSLITPRARASATLLNDGKVLVAGGSATNSPIGPLPMLASAELFDPAAATNGAFTNTGTMQNARQQHTATPLADGSVLLAGGIRSFTSSVSQLAAAERYLPSTGTFVGAPNLLVVRADHGAALLGDGRIAITAGNSNTGASRQSMQTIEVYDPGVLGDGSVTGTPAIANPSLPDGQVGAPYSFTLQGLGGTATPYNFAVVAPTSLPPGITLGTNGVFGGSPSAPGTFLFDVKISDAASPTPHSSHQTLRLRVDALAMVGSLPTAYVGRQYNQSLVSSAGYQGPPPPTPNVWTLVSGSLPPGLSVNAVTNALSGIPTTNGIFSFTYKVTDYAGQSATASLFISVNNPLQITTTSLGDGLVGQSYFGCFQISNGFFPLTWTITPQSGTHLPAGLALAPNSPCFDWSAGHQIRETGTFTFTATVTDSSTPPQSDSRTYTVRFHAQDQQVYSQTAANVPLTSTRRVAQVVTTSTPFGLTGVQLWGISSCSPGMTITAEVRPVIGAPAGPDEIGPALATASVTTDPGGYFNNSLTFPAVSLAQHARVAIVVSFAGAGSCQGVNWPAPDYYTPGHGLVSDNNSPWLLLSDAPFGRADVPMSTLTIPNDLWYLSTYRSGHAAVPLADQRVLVLGNDATAEIYDPVTQTLTPTGSMSIARWAATATLLPATGKVLVAGGYKSDCPPAPAVCTSTAVAALELFDPAGDGGKGSFSPAGSLQVGRYQHAATLLADGVSVLLTGGSTGSGNSFQTTQTAEIYDSGNLTVSLPFNMIAPHSSHTATLIPFSSKVLVAGGYGNGSQSAEIFDPATGAFTATTGAMAFRAGHTATALTTGTHQGEILLIGGTGGNYPYVLATTEFFTLATTPSGVTTSSFTPGPLLSQPRMNHTAVRLGDGRIVVLGGSGTQAGSQVLSDVEVAGANITQFARAADLLVDRTTHTATLLTDGPKAGQIFVAGGYSRSWLASRSAETYDPQSVTTPPMVIATSLLPDGAVDVTYPVTPIVVTGAAGPLQFSIPWGSLPAGLSLTAANEISGMPLPGTGGVHSFVLQVTDSATPPRVASSRAFTITVNRLTFVSPSQLPSAAPSQAYSYQLQATGVGVVSYSIEPGGQQPPNFSLTPAGLITFTSHASGYFYVNIRARDAAGQSVVKGFNINVSMPLAITTTSLDDGVAPWGYGRCLSWTGGAGSISFVKSSGALPYGLTLGGNGCVNGNPRETGTFTFTAQATDQSVPPQTVNRTLTLRVGTADQAQHGIDWQIAPPAITFGPSTALAQVFTPRMNGELRDFLTPVTCSGPLHIEIRAVTSGQPNATVLGSADVPASALGAFPGAAYFRPLAFSSPVFLTSGVPVAAVLSTGPGASCAVTSAPPSSPTQNYSYAWGDAFTGSTGNWTALSAGDATRPDMPFQAIVDEGGRLAFTISWRHMHTATLLTMGDYTGLVLLAGGYSYNQTELYNPTTSSSAGVEPGRFAAGPPLNVGRTFHTATLMPDGSVIVIGGFDGSGTPLSSAERLDPVTRVWTPIGSMSQPRFEHTATLLGNGKVLIVGGRSVGWSSPSLATTELLSSDGSYVFGAGPALTSGRAAHAATKLSDGRVLVTGGWGAGASTGGEIYEPLSNAFTVGGPMRFPRAAHVAALLDSGKVLLVGGSNESGSAPVTTAEVFDPATDSFLAIPSNEVRESARAVVLNSGKVLIAGGTDHNRVGLVSTSVYDPATQTFSPGSNLVVPRNGFTATRLSDNRVLLVGGCCDSNAAGVSAELFDPASQAIPPGLVNTAFGASVPGDGTANTFVIKSGTLPAGLTLNSSTGAITGLPTVAGIYYFVIEITNAAGRKTLREVTIQINGPLAISTATLPDGVVGITYSVTLAADGGGGARSWSHVGSLVPGLNLSADGVIAGTPSAAGSYTFTVKVTDAQGATDNRQLTLVVDPPWTTTFPDGGVVLPSGLVIDPNNQSNVYAVLNWRGIHKSADSANTWTNVTDATANLWPFDRSSVSFLTVAPGSGTFYAISGGRPFKSSNQGQSWVDLSTGFPGGVLPGYAQTLAVDSNATRLWVSTTGSGLYNSYNGGASWQPANNGLPFGETVWSLAIDPTNPDVVYAGTATNGVFKTTNAAPFWQPINGYFTSDVPLQQIFAIAINPVAPNIVYAAGRESSGTSGVARSVTGGFGWTRLAGSLTLYWQPGQNLLAISATTDTVFAGSYGSVFRWTAGGTPFVSNQIANTQVTSVALDQLGGVYAGTNGLGLFRAPAFDMSTWIPKSAGLRGINFPHSFAHSVHVDQSDPSFVYAGSINGGYLSVDAGASWLSMKLPNGSASTLLTHPLEPAALYAFQNDLWKSTDKGQTWQDRTGARGSWNDGDFAIDPNNRQTIYLAATGSWQSDSPGGIYKTTDGGATWQFMTAGLPSLVVFHAIAVHPQNGNVVFAATQGGGRYTSVPPGQQGIYRTTDGGQSWTQLHDGLPTTGLNVNQIVIHPQFPNIMYAGSETTNGGVYKSTDGGNTWTRVLAENVNTVVVDPTSTSLVYAGTWNTNGFYRSRDGGATWTTFNAGLPIQAGIESIGIDPSDPRRLFLGTTAGAYQTTFTGPAASVDLAVSMTDSPDPASLGNSLVYTIQVSNLGSTAAGVAVSDPLPGHVSFLSAVATQGSCAYNAGTVTCNLGALAPAQTATITLNTVPGASGQFTNTATVSSPQVDVATANNTSTTVTTAQASGVTSTSTAGGGGGSPFSFSCPAGSAATALRGRAGDDIDRTELWCSPFVPNGYGSASFAGAASSASPGGSSYNFTCSSGMVLTGIHGRAGIVLWGGNVVDTLGATCRNLTTGAISQPAAAGNAAPSASPFALDCPTGQAVVGLFGGQGGLLDRIGLSCR